MILVTVGLQLPFARLIRAMDRMAPRLNDELFAQIGETSSTPTNMQYARALNAEEFETKVSEADLVVSHAGVGSILAAQRNATPLVILPRKAALGEHRTDHQLDTVNAIDGRYGIIAVSHENDIESAIDEARSIDRSRIRAAQASAGLRVKTQEFIERRVEPAFGRRIFGLFSR